MIVKYLSMENACIVGENAVDVSAHGFLVYAAALWTIPIKLYLRALRASTKSLADMLKQSNQDFITLTHAHKLWA
jgi:hypothetical protein